MKTKLPLLALFVLLFTACSSDLVHTWNIDRFEIIRDNGQRTNANNIGTITFNENGSGNKNISYSIFGNNYSDKTPFNWEKHQGYIILESTKKGVSSRLTKAWIIVTNEAKKQIWKSTDGKNSIQILELSRN